MTNLTTTPRFGHTKFADMEYSIAVLLPDADNSVMADEYLVVVPSSADNRIVTFTMPDQSNDWIFEIANGDPTQTMNVVLVGGLPGQNPPQIVLPPGYTKVSIPPGFAQRIACIVGSGFCPLFAGTLVP